MVTLVKGFEPFFNIQYTHVPPPSSQPFPAPDSPFSDITPHGAPLAATHEVAIDPWLELWSPISTTSQSHEI